MKRYIFLTCLVFGLFLISCQKNSKSETETKVGNYKVPETIPLKFTDPEPFEWETLTNDALTTPVSYSLNIDALPSKPFELNQFKPLKTPMKEYDLDWDNVPSEKLKLDSVPFTVTKSTIKKPIITKMKAPVIMEGTKNNLLQLSVNEGLITNEITSIIETEDGEIWMGSTSSLSTASTLTRYDGENAFTYNYPRVVDMTFDQLGRLWLVTVYNDIHVLDFEKDIAYLIKPSIAEFVGVDIACDHSGTMYIASYTNAFYTIDAAMNNLQKLENVSNSAMTILEDRENNLWLGYLDGLVVLNKERTSFKKLQGTTDYNSNFSVFDIKEDKTGTIWVCQLNPQSQNVNTPESEVLRVSLTDKKINVLSAENGFNIPGHRIEEDDQGNYWIAGEDKMFVLHHDLKQSKTIAMNSLMFASGSRIGTLKRKDGSLWIATTDKGVIITNEYTLNTQYLSTADGLLNNEVWEIEENSRGELWLGSRGGISIIDPQLNTIKKITNEQIKGIDINSINYLKEISKDIYFIQNGYGFIIFDRQNNKITQYAGNENLNLRVSGFAALDEHQFMIYNATGLYQYDIEKNSLKKLISKTDPNILQTLFAIAIVYDGSEEILWVPTQNKGLAKVNLKNNTISYLGTKEGLCYNNVGVVNFSKEGELWVTTLNGIAILNFEENTLTNLQEENGLIPDEMYDIVEKDDKMYAASANGLIPIEKSSVKTYDSGFYNYNGGFGFKANDYLSGSSTFLKNGQFWAGVVDLANVYKLVIMNNGPKPDTTISTVHINNMFVLDENLKFDSKADNDSISKASSSDTNMKNIKWDSIKKPYSIPVGLVLPFDQNSLSFSYSSGDVFNRNQLSYRFILDGEDLDWTYAANATKTKNYYNLEPGEYTFKVASRSFNKQWSTPDVMTFRISPPWWQTWWAYLIFGLIAVGILRIYIAFRAKKLKRENKFLEEKVKERTNELEASIEDLKATQSQLIQSEKMASLGELTAGIAHEIQNPLNFVNNFSEINVELIDEMQEELKAGNNEEVIEISNDIKENQKKINHHGKRADSIVKGMLKHSRNTSGEKEPTNINAIADEYLRLAYHGLRAKDKSFNATLNTDFDESIGLINVAGQDMGRVILNLITNALHAISPNSKTPEITVKDPTIWISTKKVGDQVIIKIKDNGSGIPKEIVDKIFQPFFTTKPSGQGTGLGLSMSYDIVRSHGGDLKVESQEGEGTTFTISIPK
ncbi:GHKL domain-containing protein [Aureibaculum sp. A20]|uniref:histidine kinase n=1 Tax=Aureibaculum flavum TaxID=2795986 RepID=A0ABS0WUQ6_9FLAO|nr:ATP-binding protein [Aureibaculum flavum]MBJ2175563.1 GHKL domain-containing protein [Aureibaculum flavum]